MPKRKDLSLLQTMHHISNQQLSDITLQPGDVLANRYQVVELIGVGGMGAVYLVQDRDLGNDKKALKIMLPKFLDNPEALDRFRKEFQILQRLNHPNILRTYELGQDKRLLFYTMEYIAGPNLREWMQTQWQKGMIPAENIIPLILGVLIGLQAVHKVTIHRDIKPENLLIATDEEEKLQIKICDFGLAEFQATTTKLRTSKLMGTYNYMAPEQLSASQPASQQTDLYAVGVIVYEALTQKLPIGMFKLPSELRADLPKTLDKFIDKALAQDPQDRFRNAQEMSEALQQPQQEFKEADLLPTPTPVITVKPAETVEDTPATIKQRAATMIKNKELVTTGKRVRQQVLQHRLQKKLRTWLWHTAFFIVLLSLTVWQFSSLKMWWQNLQTWATALVSPTKLETKQASETPAQNAPLDTRANVKEPAIDYWVQAQKYETSGNLPEALTYYQNAVTGSTQFKQKAEGYLRMGKICERLHQDSRALENYRLACGYEPNSFESYQLQGAIYLKQKNWNAALNSLDCALKLREHGRTRYYRGVVYAEQRKWELALQDFQSAVRLDPVLASNVKPKITEMEKMLAQMGQQTLAQEKQCLVVEAQPYCQGA